MGHVVPDEDPTEFGNDCGHCNAGETPKHLTVTFSGLTQCTNCIYGGGGPGDGYKFLGQAAALTGNSFLLTQTNGCSWVGTDAGPFGTDEKWTVDIPSKTCTAFISSIPTTNLVITITKTGPAAIAVTAKLRTINTFFTFTGDVTAVLSHCMEISSISNDFGFPCADWLGGGALFCIGGSMKIREGDWT